MSNSNGCRILLVDPDPGWLEDAARILRQLGFSTHQATNLGRIGRTSKLDSVLEIVLVDLEFAERTPDQLRRFAQRANRYIVVLFPTGLTPHRMSRVFKLGVYDCVGKPYDSQSLIALVESLLGEVCPSTLDTTSSLTPDCVPIT